MTYFDIFTWTTAILSIIGVILNIRKSHTCFYIWAVTNASWTVIDFIKGIYAQAFLFLIYFCLAIWGLYEWKWRKHEPTNVRLDK